MTYNVFSEIGEISGSVT